MRARMTATRMILLCAALVPYVALVSVDAWMHERARRVPRFERALHYSAAVLFLGFIIAVLRDAIRPALTLLLFLAAATVWDEVSYHRHLDGRERRVHFASHAAFVLFLVAWLSSLEAT
jgi:hypothetical protein